MSISTITRPLAALLIAMTLILTPAGAHEKKKHQPQAATAAVQDGAQAPGRLDVAGAHDDSMDEMMEQVREERAAMSKGERLLDWLGRLHPSIVHFPLAFFPAALFTAIVGRRRPGFAKPVQFLVIAGGITAPVAMLLGWFDGGFVMADTDPLMRVHRWLGTFIGVASFGLAVWAWKRPQDDRSTAMLLALGLITATLIVQGWHGGAMVHGIDHMNW